VAILDRGQLRLNEPAESLQARFRAVEVILETEAVVPSTAPAHWLNPEPSGRVLRFVDSEHEAARLQGDLKQTLGSIRQLNVNPMTLRQVFVSLARTYRLKGMAAPAAATATASAAGTGLESMEDCS
jgi:ABC-2 type transport system ATP-binding protein